MKTSFYNNKITVVGIILVTAFLLLTGSKSSAQIINTFPGSTTAGFDNQYGVAVDDTGNVFAADWNLHKLDKMTPAGVNSFITLNGPVGVVFDKAGNKYLTLWDADMVIKITPQGKMDTIASIGMAGPEGIAIDPSDTILYVTDWTANRVYAISIASGRIDTIANKSGVAGNAGDNGPAVDATLGGAFAGGSLEEVAVDAFHNVYIADPASHRVRVIAGTSTSRHPIVGYIYPFAGTGVAGNTGNGANASAAQLYSPTGVRVDTAGNVYIADMVSNVIRVVDTAGIIHGFAGTGVASSTGDGGLASAATLNGPYGLAFDRYGNLYVSEQTGNRIRVISLGACSVPVVNSVSAPQSVCVNAANVSISASASGTTPIAFQWKRNNTTLSTTDSVIAIGKVSLADSGIYTVTASNFCGAAATLLTTVLHVNNLPVVTITAIQDTVCEGTQVAMTASGAPDNYVWSPTATLNGSTGAGVLATPANGSTTYTVIGTDVNGCSASATKTLVAEICTGINSVADDEVNIYPNPGNGLFTVKLSGAMLNSTLELFTITGQKIYGENAGSNYLRTINVTGYSSGIYILQITSGKEIVRKKVVVE